MAPQPFSKKAAALASQASTSRWVCNVCPHFEKCVCVDDSGVSLLWLDIYCARDCVKEQVVQGEQGGSDCVRQLGVSFVAWAASVLSCVDWFGRSSTDFAVSGRGEEGAFASELCGCGGQQCVGV